MPWWLWILVGFGLLLGEVLTPGGFFFVFFGVGAIAVGGLVSLELAGAPATQWLLFTLISLACLVPLRGRLVRWVAAEPDGTRPVDSLVGEEAVLLEDLAPGGVAKAELRGSAWNARTEDRRSLHKGERVRVARVDGLTLWLG